MSRIRIEDLEFTQDVSRDEAAAVYGGNHCQWKFEWIDTIWGFRLPWFRRVCEPQNGGGDVFTTLAIGEEDGGGAGLN